MSIPISYISELAKCTSLRTLQTIKKELTSLLIWFVILGHTFVLHTILPLYTTVRSARWIRVDRRRWRLFLLVLLRLLLFVLVCRLAAVHEEDALEDVAQVRGEVRLQLVRHTGYADEEPMHQVF